MKYVIPITGAILASLLQITMPVVWQSHLVIIDLSLIVVIIVSLLVKSSLAALWMALLAGLLMDIWLPSYFGVWTAAALASSITAIIINRKILPRQTNIGVLISAAAALFAGTTILFVVFWFGSNLSLVAHILDYLSFYLVKLLIDLVFFWLLFLGVKKITKIIYPGAHA